LDDPADDHRLDAMPEVSITVDCDVLQADGRDAHRVNLGGFVALTTP